MNSTLGHYLVNDLLPEKYRSTTVLTKGALNNLLTRIAKDDPKAYVKIVGPVKKLGDELSTLEGVSVGLDDIEPQYTTRDAIMKPAMEKIKHTKSPEEREKIILDTQEKMLDHTRKDPGSLGMMSRSGARGNNSQLMKTVGSPVAALGGNGHITPWLIGKSYSEGLSPADYWVAGNEARINTVKTSTSTAEPGDVSKIMVNTMYGLIISKQDCGTHNGLPFASNDPQAVDRYLSKDQAGFKYNDLVTPAVVAKIQSQTPHIFVRSPMTCDAHEGVCVKCQGLDENNHPHALGVNVGVRSANAMSEPLTQIALNAKHGVRILKSSVPKLSGLSGLRQLLDIPQSFFNKAPLAEHAGKVTSIKEAPHGGTYIYVNDTEHYAGPAQQPIVATGDVVEAGDRLANGIPKPDEVVFHKGLGAGRQYLVDSLHDLYKDQGMDIDKRHFELLARADLGHVKLLESIDNHPEFIRGDYMPYETYKNIANEKTKSMKVSDAEGQVLGKEVMYFTAGTPLTKSILTTLRSHDISHVDVSHSAPVVEFIMRPITRTPLLQTDWMARLAHRYLKEYLIHGAQYGDSSNSHGVNPVPAYAFGASFGEAPEGRY